MPFLSVIVPVYKAESTLVPLVESILAQSYADFELILVEAGSPDGCDALCDALARRDARILAVHLGVNEGVSVSRNAGLALARGDYVTFADADDLVVPGIYEAARAAVEATGADLVSYGFYAANDKGKTPCTHPAFSLSLADFWPEYMAYTLENGQFAFLWNKWYRRSLLEENHLQFAIGRQNAEDLLFNQQLWPHLFTVANLETPGYEYWYRPGSLTQNVKNDHLTVCKDTLALTKAFLKNCGQAALYPYFAKDFTRRCAGGYFTVLTDWSRPYTPAQRAEGLQRLYSEEWFPALRAWQTEQKGPRAALLRALAATRSPALTALPVRTLRALHRAELAPGEKSRQKASQDPGEKDEKDPGQDPGKETSHG